MKWDKGKDRRANQEPCLTSAPCMYLVHIRLSGERGNELKIVSKCLSQVDLQLKYHPEIMS